MLPTSMPSESWVSIAMKKEDKMTDKKYYCQNGDLIEVGKYYKWSDLRVKVIGIDTDRGFPVAVVDGEYWGMALNEMQSLWQEPEEEAKDKLTAREFNQGLDRLIFAGGEPIPNPRDKEIEELKAKTATLNEMMQSNLIIIREREKEIAELKEKLAEYESRRCEPAILPDEDGWIEHTTGKQPVADDVMVDVRFRDGGEIATLTAEEWVWEQGLDSSAQITHYRIVEDKQESEESFKEFFDKDCLDLDSCLYKTSAIDEKINFLVANISEYLQKKGI
jgi:hypothetical protein